VFFRSGHGRYSIIRTNGPRPRHFRAALVAWLLFCAFPGRLPAGDDPGKLLARAVSHDSYVRGSIGGYWENRYDFEGELYFYTPVVSGSRSTLYFQAASTARLIRERRRVFSLDNADYGFGFGLRRDLSDDVEFDASYGVLGSEAIDKRGSKRVDFLTFALQSRGFETPLFSDRLRWRAGAGAAVQRNFIDVDLRVENSLAWDFLYREKWKLGFDSRLEALTSKAQIMTQVSIGPRLSFREGDKITSLFLRYVDGNNVFGIQEAGLLAGCDFEQTGGQAAAGLPPLPQAARLAVAATADGRRFAFLELHSNWKVAEVHELPLVLTLEGGHENVSGRPGNMVYSIALGPKLKWGDWLVGGFVYHRSNHLLNAAQGNEKRSVNVAGAGFETRGFHGFLRSGGVPMGRSGTPWVLHLLLQSGLAFDTSLTETGTPALTAAVRCRSGKEPITPYLEGTAFLLRNFESYRVAAGIRLRNLWGVYLGWFRDNQLSGRRAGVLFGLDAALGKTE
jgi:hypothetical protein